MDMDVDCLFLTFCESRLEDSELPGRGMQMWHLPQRLQRALQPLWSPEDVEHVPPRLAEPERRRQQGFNALAPAK